jgi:hypothetical protein
VVWGSPCQVHRVPCLQHNSTQHGTHTVQQHTMSKSLGKAPSPYVTCLVQPQAACLCDMPSLHLTC